MALSGDVRKLRPNCVPDEYRHIARDAVLAFEVMAQEMDKVGGKNMAASIRLVAKSFEERYKAVLLMETLG